MKKLNYIYIILLMIVSVTHGGEKIKIKLQQPPPNKLNVKYLWKIDITNTTRENINIYLIGTATESKKGLIVSGKSKVFSVSPGTKTYTYEDFKSGEVNWKDKAIQEVLFRTNNVPEGDYTICVTAFYENNEEADQEQCIEQPVKPEGSITLITPGNGDEVDPKMPVLFSWTPLQGAKEYTLKIVGVRKGQSPEEAMKTKKAVWEKSGIRNTSVQVSGIVDTVWDDDGEGKSFAWSVTSGEVVSEIYTFSSTPSLMTTSTNCSTSLITGLPSGSHPKEVLPYGTDVVFIANRDGSLVKYNSTANTWTSYARPPDGNTNYKYCHFFRLDDNIYAVMAYDDRGGTLPGRYIINSFWSFYIPDGTWKLKGTFPDHYSIDMLFEFHLTASTANYGYFVQYDYMNYPDASIKVWQYDKTTKVWSGKSKFPNDPMPRMGAVAFGFRDKLYFGFGADVSNLSNSYSDFWEFNESTSNWRRLSNTSPRVFPAIHIINNNIYVISGYDFAGNPDGMKSTWKYRILDNRWESDCDFTTTECPGGPKGGFGFSLNNKGFVISQNCVTQLFEIWQFAH